MSRFIRFLSAAALLLAPAGPLRAQAPEPVITVVGTTIQSPADGSHWGYLSWLASTPELLRDRPYAVYLKDGGQDEALAYRHVGTVKPQTDPAVIRTLFDRSRHIGQDQEKLGDSIKAYFDQIHPDAAVPVPDMFGALAAQSLQSDEIFQMLVFMGRSHPGAALALGTGFATRIHPGVSTFELREKPPGSDEFTAVVARVTVTAGQPFVFTAPGRPVLVPSADRNGAALPAGDVTNHLNAKLRWTAPDALRRQTLLLRGFNVYRVTRAYAEARGWHTCPAPPALANLDWDGEVAAGFPQVAKVNRLPIVPRRYYTDAEVTDFNLDDSDGIKGDLDFYTQDDNRHNGLKLDDNGNGIDTHGVFVPGAEFYYYVVCEDLLGRAGASSCGTLLKICDRDPPVAPKGVRVTNEFVFNNASQTSDQRLRVTWNQLPATEGAVAYFVYRWRSLPAFKAAELANPLTLGAEHLVAGPIPHTGNGNPLSAIDNADPVNSPKIGANPQFGAAGDDAGRTIWYTVVAVDDSTCGGNFSPHSAPADGVLRDRVAPVDGGGTLSIRCCTPVLTPQNDHATTTAPANLDPDRLHFNLRVDRTGPQPGELRTVEFWLEDEKNQQIYPIDRREFPAVATQSLMVSASIPRPTAADGTYYLRGKVIQSDGRESDVATVFLQSALIPRFRHQGSFTASRLCRGVTLRSEEERCRTHETAEEGQEIAPVDIQLELAATTREWRLYRTIDGGPLTLIRQGVLGSAALPNQIIALQDPVFSPAGGEVCYFVQYFDEHGNAGPMKDLGCTKFTGKPPATPVVARIQPLEIGGVKKARLRWFCPTAGVERFEVFVSRKPSIAPSNLSSSLTHTGMGVIHAPSEEDGGSDVILAAKRYETGVIGHTLPHDGPAFSILFDDVEPDAIHRVVVVAIGTNGLKSGHSNLVEFVWQAAEEIILPEVKWPARPLPPGTKPLDWDSRIEARYLGGILPGYRRVGVRIGQSPLHRDCAKQTGFDPLNPVFILTGNVDPLTAIFTQGDWPSEPGTPPPPRLLPGMLYRYQLPNDLFDRVSGDIVQVTPLMETIAHRYEAPVGPPYLSICNGTRIYDPHIATTDGGGDVGGGNAAHHLWLLDAMPVTAGARYAYFLVAFRENGEIRTVIPAGTVDIPLNP